MAATTSPKPGVAPPAPASGASSKKWIWAAAALIVGGGLALLPTPAGLSHIGHMILAITAGIAILWASQAINNGAASVLLMALLIYVGEKPPLALSGFGTPPYWTLLAVLFYGFAMKKTGLA